MHAISGHTALRQALLGVFAVVMAFMPSLTTTRAELPPRRVKPPAWSRDVLDLFFDDARDALQGPRPDYDSFLPATSKGHLNNATSPGEVETKSRWTHLVDAETIETEIKRLAILIDSDVTTPGLFKGGGHRKCRQHFSTLAVLFAIVGQYDGEVRWKQPAPALRDLFARAGYNCKAGTDQSFREATQRKQDLTDLIRGSRPEVPKAEPQPNWSQVADRPPLMRRMELAHQGRLTKWLASRDEFSRNRLEISHEAQLLAILGEIIRQEGFDYWDDETYSSFALQLSQAGRDLSEAVDGTNYAEARDAAARATKACSGCHEDYRG
jgi:hypothetical protein